MPRWRWAARLASLPSVLTVLELGYRLFLPVRPFISRTVAHVQQRKARHPTVPRTGDGSAGQ
ncbi:hypothetical protein [Bradyrhizobium sp. HKCCYLS20291]|uniref:hypothetical protein n=1 Tax=Bradyrhizobium sp. HKCCYLS20291 TaxID=3420766 RepID=UPI003EBAA42B